MDREIQYSQIDDSVNFIDKLGPGSYFESRYVRRHPEYVACYLSTQTGCEKNCRMCHLTATGQNKKVKEASIVDLFLQAEGVLDHYTKVSEKKASVVHFNFMARREPLACTSMTHKSEDLFLGLARIAKFYHLKPRFLISSILPSTFTKEFEEIFPLIHPEIYYSLYSLDESFRKRWLPQAMPVIDALGKLYRWQRFSKKIIRIHHALIAGENDHDEDAIAIGHALTTSKLRADFTLVRYNPPTEASRESERYEEYARKLKEWSPNETRIKVLNRVGFDVKASCGMFVGP